MTSRPNLWVSKWKRSWATPPNTFKSRFTDLRDNIRLIQRQNIHSQFPLTIAMGFILWTYCVIDVRKNGDLACMRERKNNVSWSERNLMWRLLPKPSLQPLSIPSWKCGQPLHTPPGVGCVVNHVVNHVNCYFPPCKGIHTCVF